MLYSVLKKNIPEITGGVYTAKACPPRMYRGRFIKSKNNVYVIQFSTNDTIRLGQYIYGNTSDLKMVRKYNKFILAGNHIRKRGWPNKNFLDFREARKYALGLKLKNRRQWVEHCKKRNKPDNIPADVYTAYKNMGWRGYGYFLGY